MVTNNIQTLGHSFQPEVIFILSQKKRNLYKKTLSFPSKLTSLACSLTQVEAFVWALKTGSPKPSYTENTQD